MSYLHALACEFVLIAQHLCFGLSLRLMCLVHLFPVNLQARGIINAVRFGVRTPSPEGTAHPIVPEYHETIK